MHRALFLSLAALLVLPGTAGADEWSAPLDISPPGQVSSSPRVAVDPAGDAVATWGLSTPAGWTTVAASRAAGGSWQAPQTIGPAAGSSETAPVVALDREGDATVVYIDATPSGAVVRSASRPAGGEWQPPVDLARSALAMTEPRLAVDAAGDAVAVWVQGDSGGSTRVRGATRRAGASWSEAIDVSAPGLRQRSSLQYPPLDIGIDDTGHATAAWCRGQDSAIMAEAATIDARAGTASPAVAVSPAGVVAAETDVAVNPRGDAIVTWGEGDLSPTPVRAAWRAAGATRWSAPVALAQDKAYASVTSVALAPDGTATAAWETIAFGRDIAFGITARTGSRSAGFGPAAVLAAPQPAAYLDGVVVGARGDAFVSWGSARADHRFFELAARRPAASGSWETPVDITHGSDEDASSGALAADALGGAQAVWRVSGAAPVVRGASFALSAPASPTPTATATTPAPAPAPAAVLPTAPRALAAVTPTAAARPPAPPSIRGASASPRTSRASTAIRFTLSRAATVRLVFARVKRGRRVVVASERLAARSGLNRVKVGARVGKRTLRPGRYVVTITARADGLVSRVATVRFTRR